MKIFQFLFYLFRHGNLRSKPVNFKAHRREILQSTPVQQESKPSLYSKLRDILANNMLTGSFIGNLAYLKSARRINRLFFSIDSHQLVYVRILKSASTSILREILPLLEPKLKNHQLSDDEVDKLGVQYARHMLPEHANQYTLFTIVRNPFQRLVSVYLDLFNPKNKHFPYEGHLFGIFKRDMSFSEFVTVLTKIPDTLKAPHFASHYQIIKNCGGLDKINYFRLEKDSAKLKLFLESFGLNIHHSNKHQSKYEYQSFYTIDTLEKTYSLYRRDIDAFDYIQEYDELRKLCQRAKI